MELNLICIVVFLYPANDFYFIIRHSTHKIRAGILVRHNIAQCIFKTAEHMQTFEHPIDQDNIRYFIFSIPARRISGCAAFPVILIQIREFYNILPVLDFFNQRLTFYRHRTRLVFPQNIFYTKPVSGNSQSSGTFFQNSWNTAVLPCIHSRHPWCILML